MSAIPRLRTIPRWSLVTLLATQPFWGAAPPPTELTVLVPGGAGGGWDLTARAIKEAMESEGLARVRIEMAPGPGGAVGLAQLVSGHSGDEHTLLVGGLVMLSAGASNHLAISPLDTTPIARLTGDYPLVVVPASSRFKTMADLMSEVSRDPAALAWAGGSSGSLYERLLGDIYESAGLSRATLNYVPHSSGREVAESLLRGRGRAGVSEAAEVEAFVARGELRTLAVASPERIAGLNVGTLKESGFDVVAVNWRGVFAGPGLGDAARDRLSAMIETMVRSSSWKAALRRRLWTDIYLGAVPFRAFVESEQSRWSQPPPESRATPRAPSRGLSGLWLGSLALTALMFFALALWTFARRLWRPISTTPLVDAAAAKTDEPRPGPGLASIQEDEVARAFGDWKLTAAERDIAQLMLQGLRYKQIAFQRGTSERTVRQQAQIILKKAGLDGRADLAAHFLGSITRRGVAPNPSNAA